MNRSLTVLAALAFPNALMAAGDIRGVDHIAITVPDLAEARSFMETAFGCEHALDLGPFMDPNGTWMQDAIGTHKDAVMHIAELVCGNATNIELMEISSPTQDVVFPKREDFGASSIGLYTDDLRATLDRATAAGATPLAQITSVSEGPLAGRSFIYVTAPWGQQFFLMSDGAEGTAFSRSDAPVIPFSPRDLPKR